MIRAGKQVWRRWQAHYLCFEFCSSVAISVGFGVWLTRYGGDAILHGIFGERRGDLYGILAAIFASLFGSMLTVASITIAMINLDRMRLIKESPALSTLGATYISAIYWLLFSLLSALLCLWFENGLRLNIVLIILLFFSTSVTAFRVIRVVWIMSNLIRIMTISRKENCD